MPTPAGPNLVVKGKAQERELKFSGTEEGRLGIECWFGSFFGGEEGVEKEKGCAEMCW